MSLATTLRTVLLADDPLLARVSTRIYWKRLPQNPTYPALTLELISGDPQNTLHSISTLKWARVRINVWDTTYGSAYETAQVLEDAINGQTFTTLRSIVGQGQQDMYEPEIDAYYLTQDFSIWHTE